MKRTVLALLCTVVTLLAVGQEEKPDSLYSGLMIIPFPPTMYLSDSDREIAAASDMDYDALRDRFRLGLDISFTVRLEEMYGDHSLLRDTLERAREDLTRLYRNTRYAYALSPEFVRMTAEKEEAEEQKKFKNPFRKTKEEQTEKSNEPKTQQGLFGPDEKREEVKPDTEGSYMQATLKDTTVLAELSDVYGTEVFLFLNQFEIDTRFDDCIDFQNKVYNRAIRVHYDLFRADGTRLTGGVLETIFPSSVNDVGEITRRYFGGITDGFVSKVPARTEAD